VLSAAPALVLALLGLVALGAVYYRWRRRYQAQRGVDLSARLRQLHAHEHAAAVGQPTLEDAGDPPTATPTPPPARRPPRRIAVAHLPPPPSATSGHGFGAGPGNGNRRASGDGNRGASGNGNRGASGNGNHGVSCGDDVRS
jgi:hypothetical protein